MKAIRLALITTFAVLFVWTSANVYGQVSVEGSKGTELKIARSTDAFSCNGNACRREGCGDCANAFAPRLRGALAASDQPAMGLRPLIQPGDGYERGYPARFPRARSWLVPAAPGITTLPAPPMPMYTTRGPRDFFNPNPPCIGY